MNLGQNLRPSYADALIGLGTSSAAAPDLPLGMTYDDDPFTGYTGPAMYSPYEAQQRERREQREARRSRYDNDNTVDAQVFYPASSCVFVANLPESMENIKLERELNDKFGEWGAVFVKIRRDKKNMPYAFCQYTNDRDAAVAMAHGAGTMFQGRPCRVERVRANLGLEEAREVLEKHGAIGRLEEVSRDDADSHGIHQGILVEFKNYDPDRDIQATFRRHAIYRVVAHDPQRSRHAEPITDSEQTYRRRYEVDQRSIFVGNLPDIDGLEREVRLLAGEIGNVVSVQVIRKEGRSGYGMNVFAFVEYARAEVAEMAAQDLAGRRIFGCRIRVEQKETRRPGGDDRRIRTLEMPPAPRFVLRALSAVTWVNVACTRPVVLRMSATTSPQACLLSLLRP
ncbi:RNA recognition motif domain-containing protein [Apiospora aurea]|uniref:RNA recognition motif domain-containing protein n=1 Tax=Apiospora aurea TaxID=335848 RepID=A0ABR1Q3D9_9PEZI